MTRRRWIADEFGQHHDRAALTGSNATHLVRVLRARIGQEFDVATGTQVRRGRVASVSDQRVEFELFEEVPVAPTPHITLLLAIFKFERLEWAIEKCTELGAGRFVPVIARRTDPHLAKTAAKRVERWRRIAHEAAQQSRRLTPPEVASPVRLALALAPFSGTRIVLAEIEDQHTLKQALLGVGGPVALAIGPEGGWTNDEIALFAAAGWTTASLGANILRAETAAVAALAIALSELAA
jgi:16S rRNA (uracil1498-N3)-methyltransferase